MLQSDFVHRVLDDTTLTPSGTQSIPRSRAAVSNLWREALWAFESALRRCYRERRVPDLEGKL